MRGQTDGCRVVSPHSHTVLDKVANGPWAGVTSIASTRLNAGYASNGWLKYGLDNVAMPSSFLCDTGNIKGLTSCFIYCSVRNSYLWQGHLFCDVTRWIGNYMLHWNHDHVWYLSNGGQKWCHVVILSGLHVAGIGQNYIRRYHS
jgi:hypothetical protein